MFKMAFNARKMSKYYGVVTENFKGIVTSWDECENYVVGVSLARFKKFDTKIQAQKFIDSGGDYKVPIQDCSYERKMIANWLGMY
jgi:viroplasmin and RNaseH domain-containing protein